MLLCILERPVKSLSAVKERSVNTATVHFSNSFSCNYRNWLADGTVLLSQPAETLVSLVQILLGAYLFPLFLLCHLVKIKERTVMGCLFRKKKLTFYIGHVFGRRIKVFKVVHYL
jgi:hypothetical protein